MSATLFVQTCGVPLVVFLVFSCIALTIFALILVFKTKREGLLIAFLPVCFLPVFAGLAATTARLLSSIDLQLNQDSEVAIDPALLLLINMVPTFAGLMSCVPPAFVAILGRWGVAWKTAGVRLIPPRRAPVREEFYDSQSVLAKETDDYLDQLSRPNLGR